MITIYTHVINPLYFVIVKLYKRRVYLNFKDKEIVNYCERGISVSF